MKVKAAFKKFIYETFTPRTREDYAELFTRGRGGEEKTPYPWFYSRVLLFSLLAFSLLSIFYSVSFINIFTLAFAGGIFGDLAFIILLYELYPKRDLSLFALVSALIVGGLLSTGYSTLLYGVRVTAPFASQLWTAFVEETGKALTTIILLLVIKKRNPMCCLLIGAAVGGGYSAFENMWYMYTEGLAYGGAASLSVALQTGLWRSLGTPFSHAAWAGAFGWSLSGRQPYKKWQPYAVFAFNFVMHFFVNFPLTQMFSGWRGYPISAVTGILSIIFIIYLICSSRRAVASDCFADEGLIVNPAYLIPPPVSAEYTPGAAVITEERDAGLSQKYRFMANVLAAAAIFCFSFALLGPTCIFGGYARFKSYAFATFGEARQLAQNGMTFDYNEDRPMAEYDDLSQNYAYTFYDGRITRVTQREQFGEYLYTYEYINVKYTNIYTDSEGRYFVISDGKQVFADPVDGQPPEEVFVWELGYVGVEIDGVAYYRQNIYVDKPLTASDDSGQPVDFYTVYHYFAVNPNVSYISAEPGGGFSVRVREDVPIRLGGSIAFTVIFGAAATACGVGYIVYKKKARRT